jgi:molybdate transport system substrate-binding protein
MFRPMLLAAALLLPGIAQADEIRVVSSGGVAAAFKELIPQFEKASGHTISVGWGPSMGATVDAVPQRLARHEPIDMVIMVGYALGKMVDAGQVAAADRLDLADSKIGMAVKAGAPKPDISTVEALKSTLLAAKSVAYSDSASGVYIEKQMYKKMGIEDQMKPKSHMNPSAAWLPAARRRSGFSNWPS